MRLVTRVTIGNRPTEEFLSSEITFINNVYVTLRVRGVNDDICKRVYDAMLAGDIGKFRF